MPAPTLEPAARLRRTRTRTRNVSSLPAIALSALRPHQYDLRCACPSLVCVDCGTWVPITGFTGRTPKLVPHHTERAGTPAPVRCPSSNRRVVRDVSTATWERDVREGATQAAGSRATTVTPKPKAVPPAPPVMQFSSDVLADAKLARERSEAHIAGCSACHVTPADAGRKLAPQKRQRQREEARQIRAQDLANRCADGQHLAWVAAHTEYAATRTRSWRPSPREVLAARTAHLMKCLADTAPASCREVTATAPAHRCPAFTKLTALYDALTAPQPESELDAILDARADGLLARRRRTLAGRERAAAWAALAPRVAEIEAQRRQFPTGDLPLGAPPVPLTTLHPTRTITT